MRRILLSPGWLVKRFALVFFPLTFAVLGRWQWNVSNSPSGGLQTTSYAFQWWSFGLIFIYGWWRVIREELRNCEQGPVMAELVQAALGDEGWVPETVSRHHLLVPTEDASEAEVRDFSRYLPQLHALDQARRAAETV
ncbi:MAG: hypothetical protein ACYCO3_10565 [Mycobacteriales bacterium]